MSKATEDMMDRLHLLTAKELARVIEEGIPVYDKETGEETAREPCPASYISAAIKFLKDNDITSSNVDGRMDAINDALEDLPEFEGDEGAEKYAYN